MSTARTRPSLESHSYIGNRLRSLNVHPCSSRIVGLGPAPVSRTKSSPRPGTSTTRPLGSGGGNGACGSAAAIRRRSVGSEARAAILSAPTPRVAPSGPAPRRSAARSGQRPRRRRATAVADREGRRPPAVTTPTVSPSGIRAGGENQTSVVRNPFAEGREVRRTQVGDRRRVDETVPDDRHQADHLLPCPKREEGRVAQELDQRVPIPACFSRRVWAVTAASGSGGVSRKPGPLVVIRAGGEQLLTTSSEPSGGRRLAGTRTVLRAFLVRRPDGDRLVVATDGGDDAPATGCVHTATPEVEPPDAGRRVPAASPSRSWTTSSTSPKPGHGERRARGRPPPHVWWSPIRWRGSARSGPEPTSHRNHWEVAPGLERRSRPPRPTCSSSRSARASASRNGASSRKPDSPSSSSMLHGADPPAGSAVLLVRFLDRLGRTACRMDSALSASRRPAAGGAGGRRPRDRTSFPA